MTAMPLLLMDLDDTLVDRTAAFRLGVVDLLDRYGLPAVDADWVMELDAGGHAPREAVATGMMARYGELWSTEKLVALLRQGVVEHVSLAEDTRCSLERAADLGWTVVIVTNGATIQQEAKIRAVGLDRLVAGWVVSEAVGFAKPDPRIFRAAARLVGLPLDGAWMLGDDPERDVAGAAASGLRTVWLAHGRGWPEASFAPSFVAEHAAEAIGYVLDSFPS